jgi:hypothetical protein
MGPTDNESDASSSLPPPSSLGVQHRDVLPQGKPRGVATVNGKSFEEAGIQGSDYKEHEYDPKHIWEEAEKGRDRETWGSVSSGSTADSEAPSSNEGGDGSGMMAKMVSLVKSR